MGPEQKALTVSEYVWLTDTIADVQIIAANAEAATLYGYDRPEQLIGRYLSQTLPKEDMLRGCLYSLARQRGIDAPSDYVTHIKQPRGAIVPIHKETFQLKSMNSTLFIIFLEPANDESYDDLPLLESMGLTQEDLLAWRGTMNIADIEEIMSDHLDIYSKKT